MPGLFVGEDELSVGKNIEHAEPGHTNLGLDSEFFFEQFLQAHGPSAVLGSNEAALDLNVHLLRPVYYTNPALRAEQEL